MKNLRKIFVITTLLQSIAMHVLASYNDALPEERQRIEQSQFTQADRESAMFQNYTRAYPMLAEGFKVIGFDGHDAQHPCFDAWMKNQIRAAKVLDTNFNRYASESYGWMLYEGRAIEKAERFLVVRCQTPFQKYLYNAINGNVNLYAQLQQLQQEEAAAQISAQESKVFKFVIHHKDSLFSEALQEYINTIPYLNQSVKKNNESMVKFLINLGADVNKDCSLHVAAENDLYNIAKILIDHGADVNKKDSISHTPLYNATLHNSDNVVQLLIDHGADINTRYHYDPDLNNRGLTLLHFVQDNSVNRF